ncbi:MULTISPECIES: metalloregulator ArsR/SmtB family transcription factor [Pseudomonas]|uniref:Metalloregulator ArsR/SmtB family transcription factor n=1 Tax=Pseudomonas coleopterorum TaxID=1605838 RepID=A0AAJ6M244_9PSED|nr:MULTISPECIES: metalloregulator ArsR/SmtB family transcription factor [Pseudomonas]MBD8481428.1 metalloregulator ArsR/SmtB family transcription factor [Pseudomonas coleopterorum]MBD8592129.1 metalloregulator ArsR/SmtB family transcription factor [Pseudomonas sp. CFBP 8758]WNC11184.1 metalloregulator ArsR/SmtB family transcription factor [Pseudomonas coleopterorum]
MDLLPATVFKCLGDETRTRIMLMLADQDELCVCELIWALDDSQPKISRHLAQLRNCGLLADRRQGQWIYYRLHPQLPEWVMQVLQITRSANQSWIDQDVSRLASMEGRPVRQAACC